MSTSTNIQLNDTVIPSIPFIWYREEELTCPIDYFAELQPNKLNSLYNINLNKNIFIAIQRNISSSNLYLCLHSLLYYYEHKHITNPIIVVDPNYNKNINFAVSTQVLNGSIVELPNGIKNNSTVSGSVFIHNSAFSPPGCLHFRVPEDSKTTILFHIVCPSLNIDVYSLIIIFDETKNPYDNEIKNDIKTFCT